MDYSSILFISLIILLSYRNGLRARQKGKNVLIFGVLTFISVFTFFFIGIGLVLYLCGYEVDLKLFADPKNQPILIGQLGNAFKNNQLRPFTILLSAYGGYLLIRYLVERIPEKKSKAPLLPDQENIH